VVTAELTLSALKQSSPLIHLPLKPKARQRGFKVKSKPCEISPLIVKTHDVIQSVAKNPEVFRVLGFVLCFRKDFLFGLDSSFHSE
jgi:hypothetical protein